MGSPELSYPELENSFLKKIKDNNLLVQLLIAVSVFAILTIIILYGYQLPD